MINVCKLCLVVYDMPMYMVIGGGYVVFAGFVMGILIVGET